MEQLNPTLADGLWTWRQQVGGAAMILSTLSPADTVAAARQVARELARHDRVVVLSGIGARAPLFWHIPAGKELDSVKPDLVLLLLQRSLTPSTRLLLAMSDQVIMVTGTAAEDRGESWKLMRTILEEASPSHIEVVVVAESSTAAADAGGRLTEMAKGCFRVRASWRHLPVPQVRAGAGREEEGTMGVVKTPSASLTEAEVRAKEWEASFRRAEQLLREARETLQRIGKPGEPMPPPRAAEPASSRAQQAM